MAGWQKGRKKPRWLCPLYFRDRLCYTGRRFMSEAHRSDIAQVDEPASGADRDAKIEQLLLLGLDYYFAARYELAINVWTRALFIDRGHARARAYIDRARSALAERQRESEELLQNGVAAFERGAGDEARRLLQAAIEGGAPSEEALAVLERLNRLETAAAPAPARRADRVPRAGVALSVKITRRSPVWRAMFGALALVAIVGAGAVAVSRTGVGVRSFLALAGNLASPEASTAAPVARQVSLAMPRRGEMILAQAHALMARGHFREALTALDTLRATDPQRAEADRLRAEIQRQLIALATMPPVPVPALPARERGDRRVP
jgi:tetratricopeptide (TPR) repeat protein